MEAINPTEFFRSFGKTSGENKNPEQGGSAIMKKKVPEKNAHVRKSRQTSENKSKQETSFESRSGEETLALNDAKWKLSQPSARSSRMKNLPKTAASSAVQSITINEDAMILEQDGSTMKEARKHKGEEAIKKKCKVGNENIDKTKMDDITSGKKKTRSRMVHENSKITKSVDAKSKLDELVEIESSQEVNFL